MILISPTWLVFGQYLQLNIYKMYNIYTPHLYAYTFHGSCSTSRYILLNVANNFDLSAIFQISQYIILTTSNLIYYNMLIRRIRNPFVYTMQLGCGYIIYMRSTSMFIYIIYNMCNKYNMRVAGNAGKLF